MDLPDVGKGAEELRPLVAGQNDIDHRLGESPLQFHKQWRQQQQVAEPMIRAADEDAMNVRSR
ncbi:MAG: hypothetical protein ABI304_09930 [Rudaea sp.]